MRNGHWCCITICHFGRKLLQSRTPELIKILKNDKTVAIFGKFWYLDPINGRILKIQGGPKKTSKIQISIKSGKRNRFISYLDQIFLGLVCVSGPKRNIIGCILLKNWDQMWMTVKKPVNKTTFYSSNKFRYFAHGVFFGALIKFISQGREMPFTCALFGKSGKCISWNYQENCLKIAENLSKIAKMTKNGGFWRLFALLKATNTFFSRSW